MKLAEQEAQIGKKMEKKQRRARRNAMHSRQDEIQNDTLDQEGYPQATMLKAIPVVVRRKPQAASYIRKVEAAIVVLNGIVKDIIDRKGAETCANLVKTYSDFKQELQWRLSDAITSNASGENKTSTPPSTPVTFELVKAIELLAPRLFKAKVVKEAMKHPDVLGAGAKKRKRIRSKKDKKATVMAEFERGTLHSSSGEKVTNPEQAVAIAYSEAGEGKKAKKSFGLVLFPKLLKAQNDLRKRHAKRRASASIPSS